jgi:nicotinamidase-related amidase
MHQSSLQQGFVYEPLTPDNAVFLFIDLQVGPLSTTRTMDQEKLKGNALALARVAQMHSIPVLFTAGNQTGPGGTFLPELTQLLPDTPVIRRSTINSLHSADVLVAIEQTGRRKLVLAGLASDVGVLHAALAARARGYATYVVWDVTGTITIRSEQAAMSRMRQADVILSSWSSLATEIQQDFSKEHGRELLGLISQHLQEDVKEESEQ